MNIMRNNTMEEILKYLEEINNKYYQQLDEYSKGNDVLNKNNLVKN